MGSSRVMTKKRPAAMRRRRPQSCSCHNRTFRRKKRTQISLRGDQPASLRLASALSLLHPSVRTQHKRSCSSPLTFRDRLKQGKVLDMLQGSKQSAALSAPPLPTATTGASLAPTCNELVPCPSHNRVGVGLMYRRSGGGGRARRRRTSGPRPPGKRAEDQDGSAYSLVSRPPTETGTQRPASRPLEML
jgi:hypothetical protein